MMGTRRGLRHLSRRWRRLSVDYLESDLVYASGLIVKGMTHMMWEVKHRGQNKSANIELVDFISALAKHVEARRAEEQRCKEERFVNALLLVRPWGQ